MKSFHDQAGAIANQIRDLKHELNSEDRTDVVEYLQTQIAALEDARQSIRTLAGLAQLFVEAAQ